MILGRRLPRALALALWIAVLAPRTFAATSSEALDHYHQGATHYSRGELESALSEFRSALGLDPGPHKGARVGMHFEDYDPLFQIGRIEARLGHFEEARKMFDACAGSGYTERSENADEFRRWRATIKEALAAGASAQSQKPPASSTATSAPPPSTSPGPAAINMAAVTSSPAPQAIHPSTASSSPAGEITEPSGARPNPAPIGTEKKVPEPRTTGIGEVVRIAPPSTAETVRPAPPTTASNHPSQSSPVAPARHPLAGATWAWLGAAAAALLLGAFATLRARRATSGTAELSFGKYAIGDLIAAGRHSFVYGASERKTHEPVVLKLRRASKNGEGADRFEREAQALELVKRAPISSLGHRLIARGAVKRGSETVEYVALERLEGRTLLDFSRNARRKLDSRVCIDILQAVVAALDRGRELGLGHDELSADDIFLLEPLPLNAGNPVALRVFGWTERREEIDSEVRGVAAIAVEIFRGRGRSWDESDALDRVPSPLRELLARVGAEENGSLPSLGELSSALELCRRSTGELKEASP